MQGQWRAVDVGDVGEQLVGAFQNPGLLMGIPLALAGAVFMSLGAQYQHRGVAKVERISGETGASGLSLKLLLSLLTRPSWIIGTIMLGLAIVCQLGALAVAPLIVVQPLGAIALVLTTLLNARVSGVTPTRKSVVSIVACVGGIFLFVFVAALYAVESEATDRQLLVILAILLVVMILQSAAWLILRHRMRALFYIIGAGILYGFVATLAKVVIRRVQESNFEWITVICVIALIAAAAVGAYYVQSAYASGPPDLVIAGLTVVDPLIAVVIGLAVLREAATAPPGVFIAFAAFGAIAVWGVFSLSRNHPQLVAEGASVAPATSVERTSPVREREPEPDEDGETAGS